MPIEIKELHFFNSKREEECEKQKRVPLRALLLCIV